MRAEVAPWNVSVRVGRKPAHHPSGTVASGNHWVALHELALELDNFVLLVLEAAGTKCVGLEMATAGNNSEVDAVYEKDNREVALCDRAMALLIPYDDFDMAADGISEAPAYLER